MLILALFACSGNEDTGLVGDATAGEDVYAAACSACHGASGEGGSGPAMEGTISGRTDAQLESVMEFGAGEMPPIDMSDQERADVIAWLRLNFG